jgi:hypothetical protein
MAKKPATTADMSAYIREHGFTEAIRVFGHSYTYGLIHPEEAEPAAQVRDSLGRVTSHRTPCDDGKHGDCQDHSCDCSHHTFGWMTQVDQFLHDTGK